VTVQVRSAPTIFGCIVGATLVVAEASDHMIPYREPDFLIRHVAEVVRLAK